MIYIFFSEDYVPTFEPTISSHEPEPAPRRAAPEPAPRRIAPPEPQPGPSAASSNTEMPSMSAEGLFTIYDKLSREITQRYNYLLSFLFGTTSNGKNLLHMAANSFLYE